MEVDMDFIFRVAGSRKRGFTKQDISMMCTVFKVNNFDLNKFTRRCRRYDIGYHCKNGSWFYDETFYFVNFVQCIHETDGNYFGMAMGGVPFWLQDKKELFKNIFPVGDFI